MFKCILFVITQCMFRWHCAYVCLDGIVHMCACPVLFFWRLTIKVQLRGSRLSRFGTRAGAQFIVWVVRLTKEIWTRYYRTVMNRVHRHRAWPLGITLRKVGHDFSLVWVSVAPTKDQYISIQSLLFSWLSIRLTLKHTDTLLSTLCYNSITEEGKAILSLIHTLVTVSKPELFSLSNESSRNKFFT